MTSNTGLNFCVRPSRSYYAGKANALAISILVHKIGGPIKDSSYSRVESNKVGMVSDIKRIKFIIYLFNEHVTSI